LPGWFTHTYAHSNSHANTFAESFSYAYSVSLTNSNRNATFKSYSYTEAAPDSAFAPNATIDFVMSQKVKVVTTLQGKASLHG
jgi:hypothetical protein